MTELVRYCPSCESERPASELSCEGTVGGSLCNWDLFNTRLMPTGWRPAQVVPLVESTAAPEGFQSRCTNGHAFEEGDLICSICGADPAQQEAVSTAMPPTQSEETIIHGWRVLHQVSSTVGRRDRYLVENSEFEQKAILTLYHHGWEPDPDVYEALKRVSLEDVPKIFTTGRWQDRAFEVTEQLTGGTLADLGIVVSNSTALRRITYELGKALDALAEVGLRHRDIRPGTLLVRNRDPIDLVIGGFGSARLSEYDLDIVSPLEVTRYTAPEAMAGGVAAASDWWSLGIVLLEQITGGKCFEGIDHQAFLIHVLANGVPIPADIPGDVALLLRGLLARDRFKRWKWVQVKSWLDGESPEAPEAVTEKGVADNIGPSINLNSKRYFTGTTYALAAASASNWEEARDQLVRGVVTEWLSAVNATAEQLAALRRIIKDETLNDDWRLLIALKVLNLDMPPVIKGAIISPKWLLESPIEGYALISGPVPDMLHELGQDTWLMRLKSRAASVRERADDLNIALDEDSLRIYTLSTSRTRLAAEWDTRRRVFPDSEHMGLLNLLERRSLNEENLIVVLSASLTQFRSSDSIVEEAQLLAGTNQVLSFDANVAKEVVSLPRGEILEAVDKRIEGFARCNNELIDDWADRFRLDRRMTLAKALVLLSIPQNEWQEPQKQQYVSHLLSFFEKKIVTTVLRGPLVRMTIGKSTPRVDLLELQSQRLDAGVLLDHILRRTGTSVALDPSAFTAVVGGIEKTTGHRLQALERESDLYKRDTGIDGLYLGFPFLLTKEAKANATTRIAPVLLWPVRVRHEIGARSNVQVYFDIDREEVRVNPALETLVGQETVKRWATTADELLQRNTLRAADVIDAFGMLAPPRSRELVALVGPNHDVEVGTMHLECAAVMFHMTFMGQAIGEEIRKLRSMSPVGTGLETALRLKSSSEVLTQAPPRPKEIDRYFTVFSDPSQELAVLQARAAPGLLVEGPPGTGKSQTIVNMVGDAIGQGRSVLIVCQKHAALEVVKKRLDAEGLSERLVMVNDVNKDRLPVIRSVREQIEALTTRRTDSASLIRRKREAVSARIEAYEATLDKHHSALHTVDEAVGLSYRSLLGELIELENPNIPLEVPALRPMLQRLDIVQLATLEEEVAPAVRYWLPAKFEGSALSDVLPFSSDIATLNDFRVAFQRLVKAEQIRKEVLTTQVASFEVDDPNPHRNWITAYGNDFLQMADDHRVMLAKWLYLFRGSNEHELEGPKCIAELRYLRDQLSSCSEVVADLKLSRLLCKLPTDELAQLRSLSAEAIQPVGFLAWFNVFRKIRKLKVARFLESVGDIVSIERMSELIKASDLEKELRPLRNSLIGLHKRLQLPVPEFDAGMEMQGIVSESLLALEDTANHAKHLQMAQWSNRLDKVALEGNRESFLKLFAEFEVAFARHEVRTDSLSALAQLEFWMSPTWSERLKNSINQNEDNSALINPIENALPSIAAYQIFRGRAAQMSEPALQLLMVLRSKETHLNSIPSMELESAVRRILNREARLGWKLTMEQKVSELSLEREELANKIAVLDELDKEMRQWNQQLLQVDFDIQNIRPLRDWEDITRLSGQRVRRLREFIEIGAGLGLMKLRPVWLMNPDVASRILPLKAGFFDTVIYDEASQMPVEFSIPTLFRGKVIVVSGDEKQMPPSSFFTSKVESDEANVFDGELLDEYASRDERDAFEETWNRREIKDCPDLLQLARTNLPNTRLQIHYRSAYRELISFSNAAFYANDLSVPVHHPDEIIRQVQPIEMVKINGVYQDQTNRMEAEKVVDILSDIWKLSYAQRPSVGVVTFNRKQADLILDLIQDATEQDPDFRAAYSQETERYESGEDMRFFVRNVENVQGDERDVILFSSTFGRDSKNVFRKLFGVLGQKGGERRLNVAVTRARKKIYMVTSMPITEISNLLTTRGNPSTPRDFLQGYMEYARLVSEGEFDTARGLLSRIMPRREASKFSLEKISEDGFYFAVGDFLRSLGHDVESTDNADAFGLDYAIKHPDNGLFAIGIECDAPWHSLLEHARAREVWRPQVLQRSLSVLHRVSCYGWYHEPEQEKARLLDAVKAALDYKAVL